MLSRRIAPALALWLLAGPASAHHVMDGTVPGTLAQGLLSGLGHPIIGLDHLAVLVGIGLLASRFPRGLALVPAFVAAMAAGAFVHMAGIGLPAGEVWVALSVVAVGAAAALRPMLPLGLAALLFAAAGFVHGHALAESIIGAEPTPLVAYLVGLVAIQTALAAGAFLTARLVADRAPATAEARLRIAGLVVAAFGIGALGLTLAAGA